MAQFLMFIFYHEKGTPLMLQSVSRSLLGACILAAGLTGCGKAAIEQPTNVITASEAGNNPYPYKDGMPKNVNKTGGGGGGVAPGKGGSGGPPGGATGPGGPPK